MATRPTITLRRGGDRKLAGVCSGLAASSGMDPNLVRAGFVLLGLVAGIGVVLYVVLAVVLPDADAPAGQPIALEASIRHLQRPIGAALLLGGVLLLLANLGANIPIGAIFGPSIGAFCITAAWESFGDAEKTLVRGRASRLGGRDTMLRLFFGAVLVAAGLATILATGQGFSVLRQVVLAAVVTIGGLALILYPWVRGLLDDLGDERRDRIRSEERAEVAADLHDSVLQTLALVQRNAERPRDVVTLARQQERELRAWLYGDRSGAPRTGSLGAAIEAMAAEVEALHGIEIDVVVVGDCELDADGDALVQAAREAVVNAAKHSGVNEVSVYVEAEEEKASVFVRDRGAGFDPEAVDDDRKGIAESIKRRLARHGGKASIVSAPGEGTEVTLELSR